MEFKLQMMALAVILGILIIVGVLKIVIISNADIPEWVKWILIFRK